MGKKETYFYTCSAPGGNSYYPPGMPQVHLQPELTIAAEKPFSTGPSHTCLATHEMLFFNPDTFEIGKTYDICMGAPPILILGAEILSKGENEYFPAWLKERLARPGHKNEIWWTIRSERTGLTFVRVNQESIIKGRILNTIGLALKRPD